MVDNPARANFKDLRFKSSNPYNVHFTNVGLPLVGRKERARLHQESQREQVALFGGGPSDIENEDTDADGIVTKTIESLR